MKFDRPSFWLAIPLILIMTIINGYVIYTSVQEMQKDASIVNIAGKIRGGIQKVSKLESNGVSAEQDSEKIDSLFRTLYSDPTHFQNNIAEERFKNRLDELQIEWKRLQSAIRDYRLTQNPKLQRRIIEQSETCWTIADESVKQAQISAEMKISKVEKLIYLLLFDFLVFAFIARYVSQLIRSIETKEKERLQKVLEIQKVLEAELLKAKDIAEEALCSKSQFLANMSHEIRTPLNAIIGFIPMLEKRNTDPESKKYLQIIHKSSTALLEIVNDILDYSKINSQKLVLESYPFHPCEKMEEIIELFAPSAQEKKIDFLTFIDPNMPPCLIGDITRIKQIISNLLSNAIKFTPINGNIRVKIDYNHQSGTLTCAIKDSGIGMSADQQKNIFSPFEQSDATITRKFGGTGLGLAICKSLCDLMDGDIHLSSQSEKGSTFVLTIPLPLCDHPTAVDLPPRSEGITYYVMGGDKEEGYIKLIEKYLETLNIKKISSEEHASFILTDHHPDQSTKPLILFTRSDVEEITDQPIYPLRLPILGSTVNEALQAALRTDIGSRYAV